MKIIYEITSIKKVYLKNDKTDFLVRYPEPMLEMTYIDDELIEQKECFTDMNALSDFLMKSKLLTTKVVIKAN